MINDYAPQKKILVHHRIMPINAIYQKMGFALGNHQIYGRKLMKTAGIWIYIVPPFTFDSYITATGSKELICIGMEKPAGKCARYAIYI
jgi:putative mRNA 3-end processing factor